MKKRKGKRENFIWAETTEPPLADLTLLLFPSPPLAQLHLSADKWECETHLSAATTQSVSTVRVSELPLHGMNAKTLEDTLVRCGDAPWYRTGESYQSKRAQ